MATEVSNPNNPFDYVGRLHNEVVSQYLAAYGNSPASIAEIQQRIFNFCVQKPEYTSAYPNPTPVIIADQEFYDFANDIEHGFQNKIAAFPATAAAKGILSTLISEMLKEDQTVEVFTQIVVGLESSVMQLSGLASGEAEMLLSASSIARYSANLWVNEQGGNVSAKKAPKKRQGRSHSR